MTDNDPTRADEAEQAVITRLFDRYDSIDRAARILTRQDFYDLDLGNLFDACIQLRTQGIDDRRIDFGAALSIAGNLRFRHVSDLQTLFQPGFTQNNVEFYADMVKLASTRRTYLATAQTIRDTALEAPRASDIITGSSRAVSKALEASSPGEDLGGGLWEDLATRERKADDWVVPGYLNRGDRLVITGGEGMGKSVFLRQIAVMTTCGVNFVTGRPIEPKRVLVIDAENDEQSWVEGAREAIDTAKSMGLNPGGRLDMVFPGRLNITSHADLARVHRRIQHHKPDLLVIGPLYKLAPKGINNDDDAAPLITALDSIRDQGIAICMETHMGHVKTGAGDRDVRPRGSAALLGWPEYGKGFAPAPPAIAEHCGGDPLGILEWIPWRGDRHWRPWPKYWTRGGGKWPFTPWSDPNAAR